MLSRVGTLSSSSCHRNLLHWWYPQPLCSHPTTSTAGIQRRSSIFLNFDDMPAPRRGSEGHFADHQVTVAFRGQQAERPILAEARVLSCANAILADVAAEGFSPASVHGREGSLKKKRSIGLPEHQQGWIGTGQWQGLPFEFRGSRCASLLNSRT